MELNNTIAKPLYKQLEDQLKEEIDTGKRKAGSRLPTENELSTTYNVSRVTVRKALAGLSELGYLDRKSGKGTFVAEKHHAKYIDINDPLKDENGNLKAEYTIEGMHIKEEGYRAIFPEFIRYAME